MSHPAPPVEPRWATLSTAAAYADVSSTKTIRRWIAAGRLNGYRVNARVIRVDLNEIDAILQPIPTAKRAG